MHWGYAMGGWTMLLWFVLAVAVVGLLVWAVARSATPRGRAGARPEEILRERFARGEISREEFERTLDDLRR